MMDFNKIFGSKVFRGVLIGVGAFAAISFIFSAGMAVGFKKANFSFRWGENYHKNFGGPRDGFLQGFAGKDFIESHGVIGQIIKIDGQVIIVKGRENVERPVVIKDDTIINRGRETIKIGDLKVDDLVVIVGQPDVSGQIEAKLIRVMPAPPAPLSLFPKR